MCGIVGIISREEPAAPWVYAGLWSVQNRGQESAGIATWDGKEYREIRGMGTVGQVFNDKILTQLDGRAGIGHVRYSTAGSSTLQNAQPIAGEFRGEKFWIAHNGNLPGAGTLRKELLNCGYKFTTSPETDTEVIAAGISLSPKTSFEDALHETLGRIRGTYCLAILHKDKVYGVRDQTGNRPLLVGRGDKHMMLASESAAFDTLSIPLARDVAPGETVMLDQATHNWCTIRRLKPEPQPCIFEYVYFLRPDSVWDGTLAYEVRETMGKFLWRDYPVEADAVVAVPDSGNPAGAGLSGESGIPLVGALFRFHYAGRTFTGPIQEARLKRIRLKLNVIPKLVAGKRLIVVDDSIVRANVTLRVVEMLRRAKAKEIHLRITSPPYLHPCHYGIDTGRVAGELISARHKGDVEKIRREIGADSLRYLSLERLAEAVGRKVDSVCTACFSGKYHIPLSQPPLAA